MCIYYAGFLHWLGNWDFFFLDQYSIMEMGNSWEFDFDHSQPGIGWEFVKEGASCCSNI